MASIEDSICTFEQSLKLRELEVENSNTTFAWTTSFMQEGFQLHARKDLTPGFLMVNTNMGFKPLPAYTLQDLYDIMKDLYETKGYKIFNDWFFNHATNYDPKCVADFIIKKLEKAND